MSDSPDSKNTPHDEVKGQHDKVQITAISDDTAGYRRTAHPDAQWYAEAGLGLFFHWGISSVEGKSDLSWGMIKRPPGFPKLQADNHGIYAVQTVIPPTEYWKQAERFLCENYDPDKWLSAAREAGAKYVVLTTKHHDGFCLWPSEFGDLNTKKFLGGRDLVGEFVAACRKNDLKIGFYYSPPDWYFHRHNMSFRYGDEKPALDMNHEPYELPVVRDKESAGSPPTAGEPPVKSLMCGISAHASSMSPEEKAEFDAAYRAHVNGHVTELLTRYGQIDIFWFDGPMPEGAMTFQEIRAIQPGILLNPRGYGYGDFNTPECKFPAERFDAGWWEYCHVFADGAWGYLDHEVYKPLGWLLGEYSKTRAWDGNFLPNVAPNSHGEMPESYYLRMRQLKAWMAQNSESVVGTTGGTWPEDSNVPLTKNDGKTYAHVDWLFDEAVVAIRGIPSPRSVRLLQSGTPLPFEFTEGRLTFSIPQALRSNLTDVVVIE
ncbi:MAG: alpha-L-fucosidase [Verrucomicrobiae bacterium]